MQRDGKSYLLLTPQLKAQSTLRYFEPTAPITIPSKKFDRLSKPREMLTWDLFDFRSFTFQSSALDHLTVATLFLANLNLSGSAFLKPPPSTSESQVPRKLFKSFYNRLARWSLANK